MNLNLGRNIYGLAAIAFGIITLYWHKIDPFMNISQPAILVYLVGSVQLIGGITIQWQKTERFGALTLIAVYLIFSLYLVPPIFQMPLAYFNWGNFFEEFSIVLGGIIVYASTLKNNSEKMEKIIRAAYRCFGISVLSYALYQLFYLSYTADLVPKWIPPSQMFWAVTTTIAFALAAFAIISGRTALLASRLLMLMFIGFCLLVWLPLSFINPNELSNWVRNTETLAVAGSVWIVSDLLSQHKINSLNWSFSNLRLKQQAEVE